MADKPISFTCRCTLPQTPEDIAGQILDLKSWPEFNGYGPLPGIAKAEFEQQTAEIVGTRIRVTNRDGSSHVEDVVEWDLPCRLKLRLHDFSPPLSRLATDFEEVWEFRCESEGTKVARTMLLRPKAPPAKPVLWVLSLLLRQAIARHLWEMGGSEFVR